MAIDIFTCLRKVYEQNMNFGTYLILRGAHIRGLIFGGKFVLVSRGLIFREGLYTEFYSILGLSTETLKTSICKK